MQITPPFGYGEIVPFLKTQKVRLPAAGEFPAFVRQGNAIPLSFAEIHPAAREYPIVFTSGDSGRNFLPVAVLGIAPGENLYCEASGWAPGAYIPAYARRYPFCMSTVSVNSVTQKERLICVEKSHVDDKGEALFDAAGHPNEKWKTLERLLADYEADLDRSREMCAILADYGLFEPFTMQATLDKAPAAPMKLVGMHRVAEKSLENLNAAQLKNLMRKGILSRVYLHLASLINFGRLLERKDARGAGASGS